MKLSIPNSLLFFFMSLFCCCNTEGKETYTTVEKKNGLNIYYPNYSKIDLICNKMPSHNNKEVLMCCAASFTGELLNEFKHSNIAGNHVSSGVLYKGYVCGANSGYFEWKSDNSWKFSLGKYPNIKADSVSMSFEQVLVIHNGKKCQKQAFKNENMKNKYRVLAEYKGRLCVIDSDQYIEYCKFIDNLLSIGVTHAIYMDMGAGWNYSFYRDNDNNVVFIHNQKNNYTTNWITFYK